MQFRTFFLTTLRIAPSMTPHALLVERYTGSFVPISDCRSGWIDWYSATKSVLRCPIIGRAMARSVFSETAIGPGMNSL